MRSKIIAGFMACLAMVGFAVMHADLVLAQSTGDTGIDNSKERKKKAFMNQNDIIYFDDNCATGIGSATGKAQEGAGGDCGTPLPDTIPEYWRNLIDNAAAKYPDTDRRLVAATLWIENRGWPDPNKQWATSSASAKGPWQFIPSSWDSMGEDCNGDGKKDVNDPEDAVCAAFVHLKGSSCKPILEGATGNAESDYNSIAFKRDGNNTLMSALASYNGSGTRDGVPLAAQGRGQNPDYVKMGYWLISTNFAQTIDEDTGTKIDATKSSTAIGGTTTQVPTTGTEAECNPAGQTGTGSITRIGDYDYSFPILLPKNGVTNGVKWPCPGICHHDGSPAFDLFKTEMGDATEGTPVVAIISGTIVSVTDQRRGNAGCNDMQLEGEDGYFYWYGHSSGATVKVGQKVTAGEQLAVVGRRACADNTDPHLHIDRGPKGSWGGTLGNRDQEFVPLMNELWEKLGGGSGVDL